MELKTSTIIANIIIELNKDEIGYDEIIAYFNGISKNLIKNNYQFKKIKEEEIIGFCKYYYAYAKNDKLFNRICIINRPKLIKFFRGTEDKKFVDLFKRKYNYILPMIYKDKYLELIFNNEKVFENKNCKTDNKTGYNIIDLNLLNEEQIEEIFVDFKISKLYDKNILDNLYNLSFNKELMKHFNLHSLLNNDELKQFNENYNIAINNGVKIKDNNKIKIKQIDHN